MPLADFAGRRNWGYDGVLLYAPDSAYGRPDDLKALIDAAHLRGLMVFLDVVYNHFGPEGNYLGRYAPAFFTEAQTPWGSAIDYRVPRGARLRDRERAVLAATTTASTGCGSMRCTPSPSRARSRCCTSSAMPSASSPRETGRHIHLVLENDDNRASLLDPPQDPPRGKYRAQWNDDYHHAWHVLLTGETHGYYRDYQRSPRGDIARALALGLCLSGRSLGASRRAVARRAEPARSPPTAFVNFLQNHDQIGNRALGDRLGNAWRPPPRSKPRLAITLLAPMIAADVHGRGMGLEGAVSVLLRFRGRPGRGRAQGPAQGIRRGLCEIRRRDSRSAGSRRPFSSAVLDWDARDEPVRAAAAGAGARAARDPAARDHAAARRRRASATRRQRTTAC